MSERESHQKEGFCTKISCVTRKRGGRHNRGIKKRERGEEERARYFSPLHTCFYMCVHEEGRRRKGKCATGS